MPFQNKLLVFSTSRAIREFHSHCSTSNQIIPKSMTVSDFFSEIIVCDKKIAPEEIRLLFLSKSIDYDYFEQLGLSQNYFLFSKQSDYLFRFFEELANEKIELNSLNTADCYALYEDHINILMKILQNYKLLLESNNFFDKITLPKIYTFNYDFLKQFDSIEFFCDGYLSQFEFDCLNEISKHSSLFVYLDYSKFNKKNIEKFYFLNLDEGNRYKIDLSNFKIEDAHKLQKNDYKLQISPFAKRYEQLNFIKFAVNKMLQNRIEAKSICVVLPDESFAEDLMLLDDYKIFNFAMGKKIHSTNVFQKVNAFYEAVLNDDLLSLEKIKFFEIDVNLIEKFRVFKKFKATKDILDDLRKLIIFEDDELSQKINFIFFYFENLIKFDIGILVIELLKNFIERLLEITLDYVGGGEVTVLGILETRGIKFDGVIVVDFNENYLPKPSIKDKYISTSVKQIANLTTFIDRKNLQKHYYDTLFSCAKEVYISYVSNDEESFSTLGVELFGSNKINQNQFKMKFVDDFSNINNPKNKAIEIEFDPFLFRWSAYKLKDFLTCKRKFYLAHIAKITEANSDLYKIDKKEIGKIVHKVLQNSFFVGCDLSRLDILKSDISKNIAIFKKQNPMFIFDLTLLEHHLMKIVEFEVQNYHHDRIVWSVEKSFETKICGFNFSGVIDRIDKVGDEFWIIDYKTSSYIEIDEENDFQLEIYASLFETKNPRAFLYDLKNAKFIEKLSLADKIIALKELLGSFKKEVVDFCKCEEFAKCKFCNYKIMCGRN